MACAGQVQSLLFANRDRELIGSLILDGGLVRFGVHVEGRPYTDETSPQPGASLQRPLLVKLLERLPLTEAEQQRLLNAPLLARRSQRDLTARALRRLAEYLHFIQSCSERRGLSAAIINSLAHAYYVINTQQYLTLLIYPAAQRDSLLQSLQGLAACNKPARRALVPDSPAASSQIASGPTQLPVARIR